MPVTIRSVEPRHSNSGQPGEYRVGRNPGTNIYLYAKDEVDAYVKAMAVIEEEEKDMRAFAVCATIAILALLSATTFACESKRERYTTNMKHCVAMGKNYVSEDNSYSCRDAAAIPKPKEQTS